MLFSLEKIKHIVTFASYSKLSLQEIGGLSTFQFLAYFRRAIFYTFVSIYLRVVIGLSTTETTLMATFAMLVNVGSQSFIWGKLLDKTKKSVSFIVIGEIIAGLGHLLMMFWHKYELDNGNIKFAGYTIIISLGLIELPWSMSNVGWSALISEKTNPEERTKIMSQLSIIGGIGGITGATSGGFAYQQGNGFSDGNLFIIAAVIMIISGLIVQYTLKSNSYHFNNNQDDLLNPDNDNSNQGQTLKSFSQLPEDTKRVYILFLISLMLINFGRNSVAIITSFFIVDENAFSASDAQVAIFRNISGVATLISGIILGTALTNLKDTNVLFTGAIFALVGLVWLSIAPNFILVLIAAALLGSAMVVIQASSYSIVSKIIPDEYRGRMFAYYNATFFLSWGVGATLVTGPISDLLIANGVLAATAYRTSFLVAALLVVIGIIVLLYTIRLITHFDEELLSED